MRLFFLVLLMASFTYCSSQEKSLPATRILQSPVLDGKLNDPVWKTAPVADNFTQYFPAIGAPATVRSEVRILYDDDAIYIGAFLYDAPSQIRRQLTARDEEQQKDVDYFSIFLDTYNDQQNAFQFLVTSANVQTDARHSNSNISVFGNSGDRSWDAVWQSKTSVQEDGWIAEIRIPYISLRFTRKEIQNWGLQFMRFVRRNTETSFWSPVDPNINGFVNQFGKLQQLEHIRPPLRLSLSPYLSGGVRFNPEGNAHETEFLRNGGMDIKYGINESFTMDATLIPDFGQTISDNVVNNLSPFEVQFDENRPFFTEGVELFNKAGLFYSRRIGGTPGGYYNAIDLEASNPYWKIKKNPSVTQLYNAFKFSGRTEKKLGIGVFNAVTAPMTASLYNEATKQDTSFNTEPLTNYNIIVLDQVLRGRSYITFTNTNVIRNGAGRDANVSGLDFALFDKSNNYSISGGARKSDIYGLSPYTGFTSTVIDSIHTSNGIFLKPYGGYVGRLKLGKVSGKIQYFIQGKITSDKYDPNDLGYLQYGNTVNYNAGISYNEYQPTKNLLNYSYSFNINGNWLYKPYVFSGLDLNVNAFWLFKNMWDVSFTVGGEPVWKDDYFELRTPGKILKMPKYFYSILSGSTDSRKRLFVEYGFTFAEAELPNNPYVGINAGVRYRFSNKFSLSLNYERNYDQGQVGYAMRGANGEPVAGFRNLKELTTLASGIYNFTPRINFTVRARHYWSSVHYRSFFNVDQDGYYVNRAFIPNMDYNFNVFNIDAFFTWDFKPGSRIIAGWKNWLGDDYSISGYGSANKNYYRNFKGTFDIPHGNELTLKVIYFLDYNQLRKKS
jgi:hypothetical protein